MGTEASNIYRKVIPVPVIMIDSVYRKDENYYPKVLLEKNIIHSDNSNYPNEKIPTNSKKFQKN